MYQSELFDLCNTNQLVVSDQVVLGWIPEQYTYVSDAHCTTSWLDRVLCNQAMQRNLKSVTIIDKLPSSDHVPLSIIFDVQLQCIHSVDYNGSSSNDKVIYNRTKASVKDVNTYCMHIYNNFAKIIHDVLYLVSVQLPSLETILEYPASSRAIDAADNFKIKNTVSIGNFQIKHTLLGVFFIVISVTIYHVFFNKRTN